MNDLVVVFSVVGFTLSMAASAWLCRSNYRLAGENDRLRHDVNLLHIACDEARETFLRYAAIHNAKRTPEGDKKAHNNACLASALNNVLLDTGFEELGPMQKAVLTIRRQIMAAAKAGVTRSNVG